MSIEHLAAFIKISESIIVEYIKNLKNKGYIQQDFTDTVDPVEKANTILSGQKEMKLTY
jgi:Mn-dependent DtxR family transcriptional regulator